MRHSARSCLRVTSQHHAVLCIFSFLLNTWLTQCFPTPLAYLRKHLEATITKLHGTSYTGLCSGAHLHFYFILFYSISFPCHEENIFLPVNTCTYYVDDRYILWYFTYSFTLILYKTYPFSLMMIVDIVTIVIIILIITTTNMIIMRF